MSNDKEYQQALFSHLVMSLATSAMQHLGKLVNPATSKTEVNLDAAQSTIDVLEMLREKTKGNLGDQEARFLQQTLSGLQMNYVETSAAQEKKPATEEPAKPAAT